MPDVMRIPRPVVTKCVIRAHTLEEVSKYTDRSSRKTGRGLRPWLGTSCQHQLDQSLVLTAHYILKDFVQESSRLNVIIFVHYVLSSWRQKPKGKGINEQEKCALASTINIHHYAASEITPPLTPSATDRHDAESQRPLTTSSSKHSR